MGLFNDIGQSLIHPGRTATKVMEAATGTRPLTKEEQGNMALWGSGSVSLKNDPNNNNQLYWYSSVTGSSYKSPEEAVAAENDLRNHTGAYAPGASPEMAAATGEQTPVENPYSGFDANAAANAAMDAVTPPASTGPKPVAPRAGFTNELSAVTARPPVVERRPAATPYTSIDASGVDLTRLQGAAPAAGAGGGAGPSINTTDPGSPAPTINRDQIDKILQPLTGYQSSIAALAGDNTGQSLAELQLQKAYDIAKTNAADALRQNQAGALGAARSARNRGDRALLERQAVGEQAYLGTEAQRQQAAADRQLGYDKAILRAQEEDYDRRFKLDALTKAGELGLNQAALEKDIAAADLASATNWINQEFQQLGLDKQLGQSADQFAASLNEDKMKAILGLTRDMAAIQFQYDQLNVTDQNEADRLLMQKYGIDQQTLTALKQIKEQGKFRWDDFLGKLVGGGITGATGAIAGAVLGGGGGGGQSSGGSGVGFDNNTSTYYDPNAPPRA